MTDRASPDASRVIVASAGAGKTYRLVGRYLEQAFSAPELRLSRLLTVTFTRKAAAEMQQRIIEEAARMLTPVSGKVSPGPAAAAGLILRRSQTMRVMTMDSLFSWLVRRFALESGLPVGAETASPSGVAEILRIAWNRLLNSPSAAARLRPALEMLEGDIDRARSFLQKLYRDLRPVLYYRYGGEEEAGLLRDLLLPEEGAPGPEELRSSVWDLMRRALDEDGWPPDRRSEMAALAESGDFAALVSSRFFKPEKEGWPENDLPEEEFSLSFNYFPRKLKQYGEPVADLMRRYRLGVKRRAYNRFLTLMLELYGGYREIVSGVKAELGAVDFTDIALAACRLLRDPGIAFTVQAGVQHLLIDEFQDTNPLQWRFFRPLMEELVAGEGTYSRQSFFAVGDLKQSIYGFRGADYTLLEQLALSAGERENLVLEKLNRSWRAAPLLCDFFNTVFADGRLPMWEEHGTVRPRSPASVTVYPLVAKDDTAARRLITGRWRDDAERVARAIAAAPKRLSVRVEGENDGLRRRSCRWSDIAVIYRKARPSRYLEAALSRFGVPCRREEHGGFYERREVADTLALLDFLVEPADSAALAAVLRSPLVGIDDSGLAELLEEKSKEESLWEVLCRAGPARPRKLLADARASIGRLGLCRVLEEFFQASGARAAYRNFYGDDLPALNLDKMVDLLGEMAEKGHLSVSQCREALRRMSDEDETRMAGQAGDCVRLMTVHKAKGLEFPVLFLFDAASEMRPAGSNDTFVRLREGAGVPPLVYLPPSRLQPSGDPKFEDWRSRAAEEAAAEELRILYVALTRAAQHLFISGVEPPRPGPSQWERILSGAEALAAAGKWSVERADHCGQEALVSLRDETSLPEAPAVSVPAAAAVDEKIFDPAGPTGPVLFRPAAGEDRYRDYDSPADESGLAKHLTLGSALHLALEGWVRGKEPDPAGILDAFLEKSRPDREWVEEEMKKDLEVMASSNFLARFAGAKKLRAELPVLDLIAGRDGGELVSGVIDLAAVFPDRVEIYDYKTNRVRPGGEKRHLSKYRAQMKAYAAAAARIFKLPISAYLVFTATGKVVEI